MPKMKIRTGDYIRVSRGLEDGSREIIADGYVFDLVYSSEENKSYISIDNFKGSLPKLQSNIPLPFEGENIKIERTA